jgi:hypothetical protein
MFGYAHESFPACCGLAAGMSIRYPKAAGITRLRERAFDLG